MNRETGRIRLGRRIIVTLAFCLCVLPLFGATPNLIKNGSFETPKVPVGSFTLFATGATTVPHWTVVGASGNVAIVSSTFTANGLLFDGKGKQWVDLTGLSNTATGFAQTVATSAGSAYTLTFFVGNVVDPHGSFGTTSTVHVLVNGNQVFTATNTLGQGKTKQIWQKFTTTITATSAQTTISFINGDASNDESCGLDAIKLTLNPPDEE